jgi:hypothetical protein
MGIASGARKPAMRSRAVLAHSLTPDVKAMPTGHCPGTGPETGSDENGQKPARTLLFRIFGGESPRLWALLPRLDTAQPRPKPGAAAPRDRVFVISEKKERSERENGTKDKALARGGGAPLSQICKIFDSKTLKNTFLTSHSVTMAPSYQPRIFLSSGTAFFRAFFRVFAKVFLGLGK